MVLDSASLLNTNLAAEFGENSRKDAGRLFTSPLMIFTGVQLIFDSSVNTQLNSDILFTAFSIMTSN